MAHFRNSKYLLALLLILAGMWRGGAAHARAPDSLTSRGGLLVGYGNFNGGGIVDPIKYLSIGHWEVTAWQQFRISDWTLYAELQRSVSLNRLEVVDDKLDARVDPEPAITSLQFTLSPPARRIALTLGVHLADKGTDRRGYTARLWVQPIHSLGMGVEATTPRWSQHLSATYDGEGGALKWNARIARTRWSTSFIPVSRWRLSGTIIQDRINPRPVEIARTSD